jgi:cysteine-rich repeat protein
VQFFDLHEREFDDNKGRHERMRTAAQLAAIKAGGGMVAAMLKDDVQDTDLKGKKFNVAYTPLVGQAIADDCRHSSKTWAQALQYGVDTMGAPVAMGSDFNGIAGHVGPRFGSDACGGDVDDRVDQERAQSRMSYPFTIPGFGSFDQQTSGFKSFDYNVDGLAHIGLLPDLVADLEQIGLDPYYVDALFCSAEKYIRVWERAQAIADGDPVPDPDAEPWLCMAAECGNGFAEDGEGCDDGNTASGDGCSATCAIETGFECMGGEPSACVPTCGDSLRRGSEGCDDGNTTGGDGCSATCAVETGFMCGTGEPAVCAPICGDLLVVGGERFDDGAANGTAGSCCSAACAFVSPCVVDVEKDTFLRRTPLNTNEGGNDLLVVRPNWNRVLVAFDLGGRSASQATNASLVLTVKRNRRGFGPAGRTIGAHALSRDFSEGDGSLYKSRPRRRGSGPGATFECATDAEISNHAKDCSGPDLWRGAESVAAATSLITFTDTTAGAVAFDVTADVVAGADAWVVRRTVDLGPGGIFFWSREGAAHAGDAALAPRLVLTFPP